jgi:biofilm PGA synthesis N-glycosyltransferase PgaC
MILFDYIFFGLIALIGYSYFGYPRLLKVLARFAKYHKLPVDDAYRPRVTIFIPAYNEEAVISKKIENCLDQDYPRDLLEIMVCSDFSTDQTARIVQGYVGRGVTFFDYRERSGKTGLINKSIPAAKGDIIVLTDANTMMEAGTVSQLVRRYSSAQVGAVLGHVRLFVPHGARREGLDKEVTYREFEGRLKLYESFFGCAIGAFGGLYSIRKELFKPLPPNAYSNDDLLIPMRILGKGYRIHFCFEALSMEETGGTIAEEYKRRIRIGAGNFQSFFFLLAMCNPFHFSRFFFYFSHKVLRWYSPLLLAVVLALNAVLIMQRLFLVFFMLQLLFYACAGVGAVAARARRTLPIFSGIHHFVSINIAVCRGFFVYCKGIKSAVWTSTARPEA